MFVLPAVVGAGCTAATLKGSVEVWVGAVAAAAVTFVFVAALQLLAWRKRKQAHADEFGMGK